MLDWTRAEAAARDIAAGWAGAAGPGGAIMLFDADGLRGSACGGLASIEQGVPFTPSTTTRLASLSKHFLAATLLRNRIPFAMPLGELLPELGGEIAALPLARALDMTGALPDMMETLWQLGVPYTAGLDRDAVFALACRLTRLNATPGTEMAYSNTGWRLAQAGLERRTGRPYGELLAELAGPPEAGLRFVLDETEIVPGLATGYWRDGTQWRRGRYGVNFSASGGMAGTAEALAQWFAGLLAGRGDPDGLLASLTAPNPRADGGTGPYRFGLVVTEWDGLALVGHGGSLPGYRNHVLTLPEPGAGVVVLTNREEDALVPALAIVAALTGRAGPEPARDLPAGLYVADEGPFWAELGADHLGFMGGYEKLYADGAGGWRSLPAYLDAAIRVEGDMITGRIGGAERRLQRVPEGLALDDRFAGRWREATFGSEIAIAPDGAAIFPLAGALAAPTRPTVLPGGRALADFTHGPWRHRPCLVLAADGSLTLASHRARVLRYQRVM